MDQSDVTEPTTLNSLAGQVATLYGNGFQLALSNADVSLIVQLDNVPQLRVAMSYTTAKTLQLKMGELVAKLEEATSHSIMTSDDVAIGLAKLNDA